MSRFWDPIAIGIPISVLSVWRGSHELFNIRNRDHPDPTILVPGAPPLFFRLLYYHQDLTFFKRQVFSIIPRKIIESPYIFQIFFCCRQVGCRDRSHLWAWIPGRGLDEGGGVQVVDLVELQQGRQVVELLVPDLKAAVGQRVDDIVGDPRVLRHREHVIPGAGGGVAHQEHAVALALEPGLRLLARHRPHVPGGAV